MVRSVKISQLREMRGALIGAPCGLKEIFPRHVSVEFILIFINVWAQIQMATALE